VNLGNPLRHPVPPARQDGVLSWLARLAARRTVSLALVIAIVTTDLTIAWHGFGFVTRGLVDEPCHLATALVVLGAITRVRGTPPKPKFGWAMLVCSVLIDLDHLPAEFGSSILTAGTPRPYTHALWVVLVLIAGTVAARWWSQRARTPRAAATALILGGAAWGVSAHFLRDVATAPMSLWWPVTTAAVQIPYWCYVLALLVIIAIPPARSREKGDQGQQPATRRLLGPADHPPGAS
jgi:LexA-binding, inner membrane-associated putative hydrolase